MKVGFIGLGIMGHPMATHILKAGYDLTVFNRTVQRTEDLVQAGATLASSPAEVALRSDVIITIVSDTPDVEEVVSGADGILDGIRKGSIVVDMSTISPQAERELDAKLVKVDCSLVDAPVSGGDVGAHNGTLAIMVGARKADLTRVMPLFEVMGSTITHCGPVGHGQLTKLCNQILVSVTLLGVAEAVRFAEANNLDAAVMIEAVKGGAAGSWQLANLGPRMEKCDYAPGFMVDLLQKDLRLVTEAGDHASMPLLGTGIVRQLMTSAQALGWGREGTQVLDRVLRSIEKSDV